MCLLMLMMLVYDGAEDDGAQRQRGNEWRSTREAREWRQARGSVPQSIEAPASAA